MVLNDISFQKLTDEHFELINKFFLADKPYSDLSPVSLLCWNHGGTTAFYVNGDTLIIKLKDYLSDNYLYTIAGDSQLLDSAKLILESGTKLSFIPEYMLPKLNAINGLKVLEDRDSFDYVINLNSFVQLEGGQYKDIRKKIHGFQDEYETSITIKVFEIPESEVISSILNLNEEWCLQKSFSKEKVRDENEAIQTFFRLRTKFKSICVCLFIGEKLIAYTLNELLPNKWAMGHFGKSLNPIKYSSLYAEYVTNRELLKLGYEFINIQQDTGLTGLRETKSSYQPEFFLKKYILEL